MTGFIAKVFSFRNRVSPNEAFEVLEPDDGKPSCPVLRGPGDRKVAWLLDNLGTGNHMDVCAPSVELAHRLK